MVCVEGEDTRHGIDLHDGDEMRVMGLLAGDALSEDDALPHLRYFGRIEQETKEILYIGKFLGGLRRCHTQPVLASRACRDGPELDEVLRCNAKPLVTKTQLRKRVSSRSVVRMLGMYRAQEDVGIGEDHRLQTTFGVYGLAPDVLISEERQIQFGMALGPCAELAYPLFRR